MFVSTTLIPSLANATNISEKNFSKNETWSYTGNPYYIYGNNTVPKGITLTIGKGVQIEMQSAKFVVENGGSIVMKGTELSPITISQDQTSQGFVVRGGSSSLEIINAKVSGGKKFLDLYDKASAFISAVHIDSISGTTPISSWKNSSLTITSSNFTNILAPSSVEIFLGAIASISESTFSKAGTLNALSIYGKGILNTIANIEGVTISNTKNGIEVFNEAIAKISSTSIKGSAQTGLLMHDNADVEVLTSSFIGNDTGIESYNSSSTISESIIENNKSYGAYISGGNMYSSKNWWGDKSGPFYESANIHGSGDVIEGQTNPSPWLDTKPLNEKCCSSVLFIPGIGGSRIYQGGRFGENQLWEPNRNADVEKLFLSTDGLSINNSLYGRDIVLRTNIGLGRFDKDIYNGLYHYLNKMDESFSIRDWQYAPYDWRLFPQSIVLDGFRTKEKTATNIAIKNMQDQVKSMASISKSKKVTIIAHSYGGLVAKTLVKSLEQSGQTNLIDKLILIGVPEEGSVSAMTTILHGDNQDIGRGYILNQSTARQLALNMPSVYMSLPRQKLLDSLMSIPIVKFSAIEYFAGNYSSIFDVAKLLSFLKVENFNRPVADDLKYTKLPSKVNSYILNKSLVYSSDIDTYKVPDGIEVFNILGSGLKTLRGISYIHNSCSEVLDSALTYCGFDHVPIYSDEGDGVVLTKTLQNRSGSKIFFDMASYNKDKNKNFSHTDIVSADPILNTIGQILFNRFKIYKIPDYISVLGGSGYSSDASNALLHRPANSEAIQFKISDGVNIQATNRAGLISGYQYSQKNLIEVASEIPNSSYGIVGSSKYLITEDMPKSLSVFPVFSINNSQIQSDSDSDISSFTLDVQKITNNTSDIPTNTNLFQFKDIPIEADSKISVEILNGSSTPAIMKVDNRSSSGDTGDIYFYQPSIPDPTTGVYTSSISGPNSNQSQNTQTVGGISGTGGSTGISSTDFLWLISKIKNDLQSSSVRKNFKQRYISRLSKIESYFKAGRVRGYSDVLTHRTTLSLDLIKKELKRSRPRYYTGGMTLSESSFLHGKFIELNSALNKVMVYANL